MPERGLRLFVVERRLAAKAAGANLGLDLHGCSWWKEIVKLAMTGVERASGYPG
jgi:hypothetical protein